MNTISNYPTRIFQYLFKSFYDKPADFPSSNYGFLVFTNFVYFSALLAHFSFLLFFAYVNESFLAIFNIGSCILFIVALKLNMRGYLLISFGLVATEMVLHAIACVLILGWNSGFHYYMLGLVLIFFSASVERLFYKIAISLVIIIIYIGLYYHSLIAPPWHPLPIFFENIFNITNTLVLNLVMAVALFAGTDATAKAEAKLAEALKQIELSQQDTLKKNEELAQKNTELVELHRKADQKNAELIELHHKADRIFSALSEALPGTVLDGKYRLDEKIGSGGYGAVYKATHLTIMRNVAVKVFRPTAGNDSAEDLARFQLEAVSAGRINHPNVIQILDSGISTDGIAYLVMELLVGHSLSHELAEERVLSPARCAQIILPVCDVLFKAHSMGIIHRDIKPDNIFLHQTPEGEVVKVLDFGIAKLIDENLSLNLKNLTGHGGLMGTPVYMAPERFQLKPYDGKIDVYSVGVMLYEMLCGQPPFDTLDGNYYSLMTQHLTEAPTPLRQLNRNIPEKLETIVLKALEKNAFLRCSARELALDLTDALDIDLSNPLAPSERRLLNLAGNSDNSTKKIQMTVTGQSERVSNTVQHMENQGFAVNQTTNPKLK